MTHTYGSNWVIHTSGSHGSYIVNRWSTMGHLNKPWDIWVNHGSANVMWVNHWSTPSHLGQPWVKHGPTMGQMDLPWVDHGSRWSSEASSWLSRSLAIADPNSWVNNGQSWVIQNGPYRGPVPCPKLNFSLKLQ